MEAFKDKTTSLTSSNLSTTRLFVPPQKSMNPRQSILKVSLLQDSLMKSKLQSQTSQSDHGSKRKVTISDQIVVHEVESWKKSNQIHQPSQPRCSVCLIM